MHGFFMKANLYDKAAASVDAFKYEEYRKEAIKHKMEEKQKERITVKRKLPKVCCVVRWVLFRF